MKKNAAIAAARKMVSIEGRYTVIGPYRDTDPHGPCTEVTKATYTEARDLRASWAAGLALRLMGITHEDVDFLVRDAQGSISDRVDYALSKIEAHA